MTDKNRARELLERLWTYATDRHACLDGTPLVPLHRDTILEICERLEKPRSAICGYPLPGWRLASLRWDDSDSQPAGWIVKLVLEEGWTRRRETNVVARSDLGPLEAWDEAIRIASRCDERAAAAQVRRAEDEAPALAQKEVPNDR